MGAVRSGVALVLALSVSALAEGSTLDRDRDPVVLTGAELSSLLSADVGRVVAFRYGGGWTQIPVQIDERDVVDFGVVYNTSVSGITTLAYSDPGTYAGADSDPTFDADDELALMAADAGGRVSLPTALPAGTVGGGVELEILDPLDGGTGYVYLFRSDGSLAPGAGRSYGTYTFDLLAGSYIPDYDTSKGPNPEDSAFLSSLYRTHFSDRWIRDELNVTAGSASGIDILDRHKNMFGPNLCQRTEDTFSAGEGAFFANIDGPVRSIRSYMGANSGPLTQRIHLFYEGRQDVATHLRVHAIPGVMDLMDYSPAATGMSYYNDLNTGGVTVDGIPDTVTAGAGEWEMVTGAQGSVIIVHAFETDIPGFAATSYYSDDSTPSVAQCTGDAFEYATSGAWVAQGIPNTDPSQGAFNVMTSRRTVYYQAPGASVQDASRRRDQAATPLDVSVRPFGASPQLPVPSASPPALVGLAALLLGLGAWRVRRGR
jgi:hypothetical protein